MTFLCFKTGQLLSKCFPKTLALRSALLWLGLYPEEMMARVSLVDVSAGRETEYGTNVRWSTLSPLRV